MIRATAETSDSTHNYKPIRDYALIGDCHGSALIARDGSIDWCCLGRFDTDPVFCRILDKNRGGYFSVAPVCAFTTSREYVGFTNLLATTLQHGKGRVVMTDFMPVGRRPGSGTHNYVDLLAPHWLVRTVEAFGEPVQCSIQYKPAGFSLETRTSEVRKTGIFVENGPALYHNASGFHVSDGVAEARVELKSGERLVFVLSRGPVQGVSPIDSVDALKSTTNAFWREWIQYCRYRAPYASAVKRSLLAIKMMTYAPSGAIAASPTTSLPEVVGGDRNWDYRYCWLRDTVFALYGLAIMGYGGEARRFSSYLPRVCAATAPDLRIMYGIDGETELAERNIDTFDGYRGSRPVRVGNGAYLQRQIDVYGEILDWAVLYDAIGGHFDRDSRLMLGALADYVADHWSEPDQGIWEMRGPPRHYVHGKVMSWAALDRALRLLGPREKWSKARDSIFKEIAVRGVHNGCLVQAFEHNVPDASLLLTPMEAFPADEAVIRSTVDLVEQQLRSTHFVYRYRTEDGLTGDEGAFFICSFWLIDALLTIGRSSEAKELFERMLGHANDVGLYSEEIDTDSGEFLGNFPQAYTHLALVSSAAHLALFEKYGAEGIKGSHADRAKRQVSATLGWRALWAVFKTSLRVGRILSSRASIMPSQFAR